MTRTPSSIPGTGSELANISHWTRSRSICCRAPPEMALMFSLIRRLMMDLARCWQLDMQAIPARRDGRFVKLSNTDLRKAIRSINQGLAKPGGNDEDITQIHILNFKMANLEVHSASSRMTPVLRIHSSGSPTTITSVNHRVDSLKSDLTNFL